MRIRRIVMALLALALTVANAQAVVVEIDGVRYNAAPGAKVATVCDQSKECAGDVVIHGSIVVEGVECALGGHNPLDGSKGDVNGDGEVGIGDIVAITNIMAGKE